MSDVDEDQFRIDGRPVPELKVVELRKELEQRSLPKSGNKKELVERLINYLREERIEKNRIQQQPENVQQPTKTQTMAPAVPDMVAQYLAQQQIQLDAARRSADKYRASTSSTEEQEQQESEMAITGGEMEKQQITNADEASTIESTLARSQLPDDRATLEQSPPPEQQQGHASASAEFIPEEPTNQITDIVGMQSESATMPHDVPTFDSENPQNIDDRSLSSTESSADEQMEESPEKIEEPVATFEDETEEVGPQVEKEENGEENQYEEQVTERIADDGQIEEENAPTDEATKDEFVPDEPNDRKKGNLPKNDELVRQEEQIVEVQSSAPKRSAGDEELDYENEKDEDGEESEHELSNEAPQHKSREESQQKDSHTLATVVEVVTKKSSTTITPPSPPQHLSTRRRSSAAGVELESNKVQSSIAEPEITPEGLTRRRPVSPARNSVTRWIHIRGLKRPFTQRALFELLGKFGTVDKDAYWIDSIKSNCIITYQTVEQAELARERLHNVIWPQVGGEALVVEYSTEEKLRRRKAEELQETTEEGGGKLAERSAPTLTGGLGLTIVVENRVSESSAGPHQIQIQHSKEQMRETENRKRKAEELEKSQRTLDQIFKKTKAQPSLYYLPLSDIEVAQRHKHASNQSKSHHSSSSSQKVGDSARRDKDDHHRSSSSRNSLNRPSAYASSRR